ncbi:MAG: DedA family protein [Patescibacteria group bacterium]
MFHHLVDTMLNFADSGSSLISTFLFPIVFIAALSESTPILGTFTPGTLFLLFFGYAASLHSVNLPLLVLVATLGAIMGDILGYLLGKYAGDWLVRNKKILKQVHIEQGRGFFSKHGGKSILIGRFVGPIRPIVPLIAGSIGMSFRKFIFWNVLGAFLWAALYITLGFFFGAYAREIERVVSDASWVLLIVAILAGGFYYYKYRKNKHAKRKEIHN